MRFCFIVQFVSCILLRIFCSAAGNRSVSMAKQGTPEVSQVTQKLKDVSVTKQGSSKTEKIRVFMCTWNVGGEGPPKDMTTLLDLKEKPLPDIYAVGLQEMDLQDSDTLTNMWTSRLTDVLGDLGYFRLKVVRMQAISLQVFVLKSKIQHFTSVESEISKAGLGGWWGNKGGVSIRFDFNDVNMIIVSSHLAAHMDNTKERIEDFNTILKTQKFRDKDVDNILDHDYVFWMGDLNFRLDDTSREHVDKEIEAGDISGLLKADQLKRAMEEELIFVGFQEGPINFMPTYKFDKGTDTYDTSEKRRIPAWCDRILWHVHEDLHDVHLGVQHVSYDSPDVHHSDHKAVTALLNVNLLHYKSRPEFKSSDHKPTTALFDVCANIGAKEPFVKLDPIPKWRSGRDQKFHYFVRKGIEPDTSPWDWIGLYKTSFRHIDEYLTYVWAKNNAEKIKEGVTLEFKGKELKVPPGKYVLCYISKYKNWLRAMSNEFEIAP